MSIGTGAVCWPIQWRSERRASILHTEDAQAAVPLKLVPHIYRTCLNHVPKTVNLLCEVKSVKKRDYMDVCIAKDP